MLRIALLRPVVARAHARQFVSTVLLGKTYETETVQSLRQLAKQCGISPSGNKAKLISRIQQHDSKQTVAALASHETASAREASTTAAPQTPVEVEVPLPILSQEPAPESVTPGINVQAQHTAVLPEVFTNIRMPDISRAEPEIPTPIPSTPDYHGVPTPAATPTSNAAPKVLVVGGAATHFGGGPSHASHSESTPTESTDSQISPNFFTSTSVPKSSTFWRNLAAEFGVPNTLQLIPHPEGYAEEERIQTRPLHKEEKRGLWIMLGALVGCVAVGKVVTKKTEEVVEH